MYVYSVWDLRKFLVIAIASIENEVIIFITLQILTLKCATRPSSCGGILYALGLLQECIPVQDNLDCNNNIVTFSTSDLCSSLYFL